MKKVRDFIEKHQMITAEDHVIAGISGGADSVCLFFVLLDIRSEQGVPFTAVHVNHGLRGEAAEEDEAFVRGLCAKYQVPLEIFRADVESIAKKRKQSLEESGRNVRREAFEKTLEKYCGTKIALAHHQNDNAETLLWNLVRGTGLSGMGGIRPVNGVYIRPLLCLGRKEIEENLFRRKQGFCTDDTNRDTEYTRNRLRHFVLPVLENEVNSQAVRHMNEVMEELREVQDYMAGAVREASGKYVKASGHTGGLLIRDTLYMEETDIICTMVIRGALEMAAGQMQDIGRAHILAVRELFAKQTGRSLDLPFSIHAVRTYEGIELRRREKRAERPVIPLPENRAYSLSIPGEIQIPDMHMTVRCKVFPRSLCFSVKEIPQKVYTKWFDYDIIEAAPCIRTRQGGDHIAIDRAGHRQKLKSWFINEKIPAGERDSIPCVAAGSEILWIIGQRMSSAYQISSRTKRILQIEVVKDEHKE